MVRWAVRSWCAAHVQFFFGQIKPFADQFYKAVTKAYSLIKDPDAELAGANRFDKFGIFNLVDNLAGGDVSKYEQVLKYKAEQVQLNIMISCEKQAMERRLFEIKNKRKPQW